MNSDRLSLPYEEVTNVEQLVHNWYIRKSLCLIFLHLLVSYSTKCMNQMLELIRFQKKSLFKRRKASACNAGTQVRSLVWEDPLEKEMATHSSILAWRILWIEETGRL